MLAVCVTTTLTMNQNAAAKATISRKRKSPKIGVLVMWGSPLMTVTNRNNIAST